MELFRWLIKVKLSLKNAIPFLKATNYFS